MRDKPDGFEQFTASNMWRSRFPAVSCSPSAQPQTQSHTQPKNASSSFVASTKPSKRWLPILVRPSEKDAGGMHIFGLSGTLGQTVTKGKAYLDDGQASVRLSKARLKYTNASQFDFLPGLPMHHFMGPPGNHDHLATFVFSRKTPKMCG